MKTSQIFFLISFISRSQKKLQKVVFHFSSVSKPSCNIAAGDFRHNEGPARRTTHGSDFVHFKVFSFGEKNGPSCHLLSDVLRRCCKKISSCSLLTVTSILLSVQVPACDKPPPQHDAASTVLHSWDGVVRLARFLLFAPDVRMVVVVKQFSLSLIRTPEIIFITCGK